MKKIFFVIGRTCSGKDTIVDALSKMTGLPKFISYTTRPRRPNEGDTHIFITDDEYERISKIENFVAYTEIDGYKYFTTMSQFNQIFEDNEGAFYIIDPRGLDSMMSLRHNTFLRELMPYAIYINAADFNRRSRFIHRGGTQHDFELREAYEKDMFDNYVKLENWDISVRNDNSYIYGTLYYIETFVKEAIRYEPLYGIGEF